MSETGERSTESAPERPARRPIAWGITAVLAAAGFLVVLVLTGVVILGSLFAAGNPALSRRIVAAINGAVATDSTRFAGDRVHGTLLQGAVIENPRLLVRTIDGEVAWARARSLRVDYDLLDFVLGRARDLRVELDSPRVDVIHDRSGEIVVPRFRHREAGAASARTTRLEVSVRNGGFSLDRESIRFGSIHGRATLKLEGSRSEFLIRDFAGASETPGRPGSLQVSGLVVIAGDSLRAEPIRIGVGESRLTARADWDLAEGRFRSGLLSLHPLRLREFLSVFDVRASEGTLRGDVSFAGMASAGEARARLAGDFAGEPIDTILLEARSRPGAVEITNLKARVREAELDGDVTFFTTRGAMSADVAFLGLNPAVLPWWHSPEAMPQGRFEGRARIEARRTKPYPEAAATVTLGPSRLGKVDIHGGHARLRTSSQGGVAVDSSSFELPGGRLSVTGTLSPDQTLDAKMEGAVSDLSELAPFTGPVVLAAGTGRVSGRLTGTLKAPLVTSQGELWAVRLENGLACDTLSVDARGSLLPKLDVTAKVGARGLEAKERPLGNLDLRVSGGERLAIEEYRQSLGDTVLTLRGALTFVSEGVRARIDSVLLQTPAHRVTTRGTMDISSVRDRVRVQNLAIDLDPGTLKADIDWDPKASTLDARGSLDGLDLSRLAPLRQGRPPLAGWARGEFQANGRLEDPTISISGTIDSLQWNGIVGDRASIDASYVPGVLNVEGVEWSARQSHAKLNGTIRTRFTLRDWLDGLGKGDKSWASKASLALQAVVDSLDLGLVAPVDTTLRSLRGTATARVRITGTPAMPRFELDARAPRLGFRGVTGELVGLGLTYEERKLQLHRCDMRQGGAISKLSGEVPIDLGLYAEERLSRTEPLSLKLRIPGGDLTVLPVLFPEIAAASGRITATADVGGTARQPRITGNLAIADGKLRLAGRDEILEGITMDAVFDQERVQLTKASARQGKKGTISATGWWRWPTSGPAPGEPAAVGPRGEYAFKVKASEFTTTDRENYLFRVTGDLTIVNARNPAGAAVPQITGAVVIQKGELTLDLSKPAGEPGEPLPILYNVTVDIPGNVFYRTLDAEVELESDGNLIFRNEGDGDLALGVLNVLGGKYYILTRQFRNLQGTVNFNSPDRIDPEVNISADTTIPDPKEEHVVYLALSDRVSRLKVRVYDDAGTPPNDLWKALALGQFAPSAGVDVSSAGNGTQDMPGATLPISNYLFQNLEHWLGGTGFIDTIDLRSGASATAEGGGTGGNTGAVSMVGVGKYVTPDLYLKYSRDFSGQGEEQINADYRFTRRLLLKGQQIRRTTTTQDLPAQEYSVDLKLRLEY